MQQCRQAVAPGTPPNATSSHLCSNGAAACSMQKSRPSVFAAGAARPGARCAGAAFGQLRAEHEGVEGSYDGALLAQGEGVLAVVELSIVHHCEQVLVHPGGGGQ